MDNASKALIIVGEVLIAILVLSLMASIFISFGNFSSQMHEHMTEQQRTEFNSHFISMEDRINITAQEIATVINYAKQMNDDRELDYDTRTDSIYYTTVCIDGAVIDGSTKGTVDVFNDGSFVNSSEDYNGNLQNILNKFIKENNIYYFSCNAKVTKTETDGELKIDYEEYNEDGTISKDVTYNKQTGLINKITFHRIEYDIINVLTYKR